MDSILHKLTKSGFTPVKTTQTFTVLKSNTGVAISFTDGTIEGFVKSGVDNNALNESTFTKIGSVIIVALGFTYFNTDITIVDGPSMEPTYKNHQIIINSKSVKDVNKMLINKNSIVKFVSPEGDRSIKRIVGVPGDKLEFNKFELKINGVVADEDNREGSEQHLLKMLKKRKRFDDHRTLILKKDQYYVMGDNRQDSIDSRKYGPIDKSCIISVVGK